MISCVVIHDEFSTDRVAHGQALCVLGPATLRILCFYDCGADLNDMDCMGGVRPRTQHARAATHAGAHARRTWAQMGGGKLGMNYQSRLLMLTIAQSMYAVGILLNYCRHIQSLKVRLTGELYSLRAIIRR